ncbi:MAG: hypothetical protein ACRC06_12430 [Waterburya sp.]
MKGSSVVIYLVGFLALFTTKSAMSMPNGSYAYGSYASATTSFAIALDKGQSSLNSSKNQSTIVAQESNINIFNSCEPISKQISSSSAINNFKNTSKTDNNQHIAKQKDANTEPTQASFWWAVEQFDPFGGKLIQNWFASPKKQQINLTVNWQLWTLLDYLGRYRFVNQFGTIARKYGYSLNIFNQKEQCLGSYKYNSVSNPPKWELYLEKLGRDSLEVEPAQIIRKDDV